MFEALMTGSAIVEGIAAGWYVIKEVKELGPIKDIVFDGERVERVTRILLPRTGTLDLVPGTDHPLAKILKGHGTYANQVYAMQAIRTLYPGTAREVVDEPYPASGHWVLIGSSVANRATGVVMGSVEEPHFVYEAPHFRVEFPYSIRVVPETYVTRLQDGDPEYRRELNVVVDGQGNCVASPKYDPSNRNRLRSDVLVVIRLPRVIGAADQLILAATHGPGIRAVEKLFTQISRKDIEYLEEKFRDEDHFQAIFAVEELYENESTTLPGSIRLLRGAEASPHALKVHML